MTLLFSLIAICTIWVVGLKILTSPGMAGARLGAYAIVKVEEEEKWIYEPIIYCAWCMPSIHSLIAFGFAFGMGVIPELTYRLFFYYPLVVAGASLLSGLICSFLEGMGAGDEDDEILAEQMNKIYNES